MYKELYNNIQVVVQFNTIMLDKKYRLTKNDLLDILKSWNLFFKKNIYLIACGGTALTLLDIKESTKDIDFIIPRESDYKYLIKTISKLGYEKLTPTKWKRSNELFEFDLYLGKRIHTTELLESPFENGNHELIMELSHIFIGVLNNYDLIISKLFRGTGVDFQDCLDLMKSRFRDIDINRLEKRYKETALYEVAEARVLKNLESFLSMIKKEGLYG